MTFTNWPKKEYKNFDYEPLLEAVVLLFVIFDAHLTYYRSYFVMNFLYNVFIFLYN